MSEITNSIEEYPQNLYNMAIKNKMPHAVLIESLNMETSYKEAIRAVGISLCASKEGKPCGICDSCVKITANSHADVKTVSVPKGGKSIKTDEIRFIREDAHIMANEGKYKFYIIKSADCLTVQAQNALIKILEEPPRGVVFVLLCRSSHFLLDTVLSRCEIFKSRLQSDENSENEAYATAMKIARAYTQKEKSKILEITAQIPQNRAYFKSLVEYTAAALLSEFKKSEEESCLPNLIKTLENLRYISSSTDKNANLNLLITYFNAVL